MTVGIVGLGTIGGSFAKAVKAYTDHTVYGTDINGDAIAFAKFSDSIDGVLNEQTLPSCDIILIALYPEATVEYLQSIAPFVKKGAAVLDACGVKRVLFDRCAEIASAHSFVFLGAHPMAGAVASGFHAAREKMFKNASMILVPGSCDDLPTLDKVCGLFREIGFGKIVTCSPEEHDKRIAFTSQLPHIISNAYVKSPSAPLHRGYSAGSFRDMARVAKLNVPMWTELFLQNADFLSKELDILIQNLVLYKEALDKRDEQSLAQLLRDGADCKSDTEI
ncbi:MAG: prephenate dehydrogenase [Clostridia bacterium]|nr:prephenate dehydrogenase [Clostridia bacterium]